LSIVIYIDLQVKLLHGHFLTSGSLFATSIGNPINMNSLTTWPTPTGLQLALAQCDLCQDIRQSFRPVPASDRRSRFGLSFSPCESQSFSQCDRQPANVSPCDRPPLHQCKPPSLRQGSTKRSAYLHLSQVPKRLARPSRMMRRYRLGFLWGLWLPVAVQNMIRNSPQGMPSAERSFIPSCPTPAAGAIA
jgi:hypothetical protein